MLAESPRYLLLTGKRKEANAILEKAAVANKAAMPEGILIADVEVISQLYFQNCNSSKFQCTPFCKNIARY